MKTSLQLLFISGLLVALMTQSLHAQNPTNFTTISDIETSSVKNQHRTGTCWAFATVSFLETELIRKDNEELDLSEMYLVRYTYLTKAMDYVRFHGKNNFSQGGQAHDALNEMRKHGIVPEEIYTGREYNLSFHHHGEMEAVLSGMLDGVLKNAQSKLTDVWPEAIEAVLDVYMGTPPESFDYEGKTYTPQTFADDVVGLNLDDYVELTSYSHQPFYTHFDLEIPDNWSHDHYYNLPIDELMQVMNYALENGYSVCWDGDVSEEGFDHRGGVATLDDDSEEVTQAMRQTTFNNWSSTDDHLMHLTGLSKDNDGTMYYKTKNSWSAQSNAYDGFLYMSEPFIKLKTVAIMIHKDAIPDEIADKLFEK